MITSQTPIPQGGKGVRIQRVRHLAHGVREDGQVRPLLCQRQAGQHASPPHQVITAPILLLYYIH